MKYYGVIDTNVLVSAVLKRDSIPGTIIELAMNGLVIPVLNDDIINEYRNVLSRDKFHLTEDIVDSIVNGLARRAIVISEEHLDVSLPDPKDVVFYEVVMEKRKEDEAYLVTGNIRHFPKEHFVVTPREFLGIILSSEND